MKVRATGTIQSSENKSDGKLLRINGILLFLQPRSYSALLWNLVRTLREISFSILNWIGIFYVLFQLGNIGNKIRYETDTFSYYMHLLNSMILTSTHHHELLHDLRCIPRIITVLFILSYLPQGVQRSACEMFGRR